MTTAEHDSTAALRDSIAAWEAGRYASAPAASGIGPAACPLCAVFYKRGCHGCPIETDTHMTSCDGTPYEMALTAHDTWASLRAGQGPDADATVRARARWQRRAQAMIDYMARLLARAEGGTCAS